jgi:uncharacterized repeat protein (TIGR02543 family)
VNVSVADFGDFHVTTGTQSVAVYRDMSEGVIASFNANGGSSLSESSITKPSGTAIGTLPTVTRTGYTFNGWYTAESGGTKIDSTTMLTTDVMYYAQWTVIADETPDADDTPSDPGTGGGGDGPGTGGGEGNLPGGGGITVAGGDTSSVPVSISGAAAKKIADKAYTGKAIRPATALTVNNAALIQGTDYTVSYENNTKIGKATVTITGKGRYEGTKTIDFNIVPAKTTVSKAVPGKGQLKVTWKKVGAAQKITKYEVRYRVKGAAKWKTKSVSAKSAGVTIGKLQKGKAYQVQVRSYKTVSKVKYCSAWSKVKTSGKVK